MIWIQAVDPTVCTFHHYPVLLLRLSTWFNTSLICFCRNVWRRLSAFPWLLQVKLSTHLHEYLLRKCYVLSNVTDTGDTVMEKIDLLVPRCWQTSKSRDTWEGNKELGLWDKALHWCDGNTWEVQWSQLSGGRRGTGPGAGREWERKVKSVIKYMKWPRWSWWCLCWENTAEGGLGRKVVWFWNKIKLLWDLICYILLIRWASWFLICRLLGLQV